MPGVDEEEVQSFAEQYFASQNVLNKKILDDISIVKNNFQKEKWDQMSVVQKEKVINDSLIYPDVQSIYNKGQETKTSLLTFPNLKIRSGQKFVVDESNTTDGKPFSYRDEHSSPFGWRTRSQQNLHFDIYDSRENIQEKNEGLELVTSRRSKILSCPFGQYSSKPPRIAKPVSIPVVPHLNPGLCKEPDETASFQDMAEVTSLVSSIVIENENNIVLDFSAKIEDDQEDNIPITGRSDTSSTSLLSKVIKKCKTPTLKRKKSMSSTDTLLTTVTNDNTPDQTPTRSSPLKVVKPSCAPPPPPAVARPTAAPPPPPSSSSASTSRSQSPIPSSSAAQTTTSRPAPPPVPPTRAPGTRISTLVDVTSDPSSSHDLVQKVDKDAALIKKSGFDFLDNW